MDVRQQNSKRSGSFSKSSSLRLGRTNEPREGRQPGESLQPGTVLSVQITAFGSKNIGVAEFKNGTTILVPNTQCGEKVQVKIEKVFSSPRGQQILQKPQGKYALATVLDAQSSSDLKEKRSPSVHFDFKVGQKFKVTVQKKGPKNSGLVALSKNFFIVIPNAPVGQKIGIEIQKIKENYALAKIVESEGSSSSSRRTGLSSLNMSLSGRGKHDVHANGTDDHRLRSADSNDLVGQEFQIDIPQSAQSFGNFFVVHMNLRRLSEDWTPSSTGRNHILFVKKELGVQRGDRVQIQIQKTTENFALAQIQKVSPFSREEQKYMTHSTLQKMILAGMHFGEKALHCHANMRKYLWYRKKGFRISPTHRSARLVLQQNLQKPMVKRGRHIFNVFQTHRCLQESVKQLAKYAAKGKTFLFIGTKKPASSLIAKTAVLSQTSFFVNTRWLGGMLTNWKTILKSIAQIRPILKQKQKIQKKIFEKRQKIQRSFFQKVSLFRKKSQKIFSKGKLLLSHIFKSPQYRSTRAAHFQTQKNALLTANLSLLNAAQRLQKKKRETVLTLHELERTATHILHQKQQLQLSLSKTLQVFKDVEQFFEIGQEFLSLKNRFEKTTEFRALSSDKFETMKEGTLSGQWSIPNPSPALLKKMISLLARVKQGTLTKTEALSWTRAQSSGLTAGPRQESPDQGSNRSKSADARHVGGEGHESPSSKTVLLFSTFLKKCLSFFPFFETYFSQFQTDFRQAHALLQKFNETYQKIVCAQKTYIHVYEQTLAQISLVCSKLLRQRAKLKVFHMNFLQFAAEQRLLKFFTKFRSFPTSHAKIYETLECFLKKCVDPKFMYPMDQIYDQKLQFTSKKIATTRKQKWQRFEKYFGGITKMAKMNAKHISKNVAIIVGQQEEMSAVQECRTLGMKIFALVDTNCDPKLVDHIIPANDDSRNSIHYILGEMLTYIRLGQKLRRKVSFRAQMQQGVQQRRRFSS
jgi:ribosomal protein S2/predicted RNA-binding protein with TRAM domain